MAPLMLTGIAGIIDFEKRDLNETPEILIEKLKHRGSTYINRIESEAYHGILIQFYRDANKPSIPENSVIHGFPNNIPQSPSDCNIIRGHFAMAIGFDNGILLARDRVGVKPLFYSLKKSTLVFASEKKAIRHLGSVLRVDPGSCVLIRRDGVQLVYKRDLRYNEKTNFDFSSSYVRLADLINDSVKKIVSLISDKEVPVLFSGGLDSSTLAITIKRYAQPLLFSVFVRGSHDEKFLNERAKSLGLELISREITPDEVIDLVEETIAIIEDYDPIKVMIGVPLLAALKMVRDEGYQYAVAGQGADELFGGYAKYLRAEPHQRKKLMIDDLIHLAERNLERDEHLASHMGIELLLPYLDEDIVDFALQIPVDYKIYNETRKYILRYAALTLGLSKDIAFAPKKAIQYSTGIAKIIKAEARKRKVSIESLFKKIYLKYYSE